MPIYNHSSNAPSGTRSSSYHFTPWRPSAECLNDVNQEISVFPRQKYFVLQATHSRWQTPSYHLTPYCGNPETSLKLLPISTASNSELICCHFPASNSPYFVPYSTSQVESASQLYELKQRSFNGAYSPNNVSLAGLPEFTAPLRYHQRNIPYLTEPKPRQEASQSSSPFSRKAGEKIEKLHRVNRSAGKCPGKYVGASRILHRRWSLSEKTFDQSSSSPASPSLLASNSLSKCVQLTETETQEGKFNLNYRVKLYSQHGARGKKHKDLKFETKVFRSNYRGRFD